MDTSFGVRIREVPLYIHIYMYIVCTYVHVPDNSTQAPSKALQYRQTPARERKKGVGIKYGG